VLPRPAPAACCSDRFSVMAEPVLETCRAKARIIAGGEALIVHRIAVVERLGIGDYRPWVPGCVHCTFATNLISISCVGSANRGVTTIVLATSGLCDPYASFRTGPAAANAVSMSVT